MLSRSVLNRSSLIPLRSTVAMAPRSLLLGRNASTMRHVAAPRLISMAGPVSLKRSMSTKRHDELYSPDGLKKPWLPRLIYRMDRASGYKGDENDHNQNLPRAPPALPPLLAKLTPEEKQAMGDFLVEVSKSISPPRRVEQYWENAGKWRRWKAEFCIFHMWFAFLGVELGILSWQISDTDTYKKLQKWRKKVTGRAVSEQEEREKRVQDLKGELSLLEYRNRRDYGELKTE